MERLFKGLFKPEFLFLLGLLCNSLYAKEIDEDQLKAVFIYNFAHFVSFPIRAETDNDHSFRFCVYGDSLFNHALALTVANQLIIDQQPEIINLLNNESPNRCKIIYFPASQVDHFNKVLFAIKDKPILTVSEIKGFTHFGGIIEFIRIRNKINLLINNKKALAVGLTIKANLLSISTMVEE